MKTVKKTDLLTSVKKKLKSCDLEIQNYVAALEKENFKLHKKLATLQVENVSLNNRIKAFNGEIEHAGTKFFAKILEAADDPLNLKPKI